MLWYPNADTRLSKMQIQNAECGTGKGSPTPIIWGALMQTSLYEVESQSNDMKSKTLGNLEITFGCLKGKKIRQLTRKDKERIAEELLNNLDKQDEIFRSVGL